jgi:dTDP-4-dehydrorhamnose 3,5-epimerase
MAFHQTEIQDVIIFEPRVFEDSRGYFFESYNEKTFNDNGIKAHFVQDNQSFSKMGTVRGLHFQKGEFAQAKLVRVIRGKVIDVAVDLRPNSPTFGRHVAVELSEDNQKQLFIPRGFAHGFSVLSKEAIFSYKCDNFYNQNADGGLFFADTELAINWQVDHPIVSEKDLALPTFSEYLQSPCF